MRNTLPPEGTLPEAVEAIVAPAREAIATHARLDGAAQDARVARVDAERTYREAVRQAVVDGDKPPAEPKNLEHLAVIADEADRAERDARLAVRTAWHHMSAALKQVPPHVLDEGTDAADAAARDYLDAIDRLVAARQAYHEATSVRRWLSGACVPNPQMRPDAQASAYVQRVPASTPKTREHDALDVAPIIAALRLDAASLDGLRDKEQQMRKRAAKDARHAEHNRQLAARRAEQAERANVVTRVSH